MVPNYWSTSHGPCPWAEATCTTWRRTDVGCADWKQPGLQGSARGNEPRRIGRQLGAAVRGDGNREGADRAGDSRCGTTPPPAIRGRELRRDSGRVAGERTLRPRAGRIYRRRHTSRRPVSGGGPRHPVPGRDRRLADRTAAEAAASAPGAAG